MHGLLISMLAGCLLGPQDRAAWDDKWGVQDGGQDLDGDGYGTTDCDDGNDAVFPGAEDPWYDGVDADCGGNDDYDQDRDGYVPEEFVGLPTLSVAGSGGLPGGDCDDTDGDKSPGADELCNEEDDDCDKQVDEDAVDAATWHPDCDEDGFGDEDAGEGVEACEPPEGACPYLDDNSDCDDGDVEVHPDATEMCNEIDDDCNDAVDENSAADAPTWYPDLDGDSHGDDERASTQCDPPALTGYIEEGGDCDDGDPDVHADATEVCNEIDDDCDDEVDEADADDASTWYADVDGDGYGDAEVEIVACWLPEMSVANSDDCDDGDEAVKPGAEEICDDGVDQDCDGLADTCEVAYSHWYPGTRTTDDQWANAAAFVPGVGFLLSSYGSDGPGGTSESNKGAIALLSSTSASTIGSTRAMGESTGDLFGSDLGSTGDIDGDGIADFAIGAQGVDDNEDGYHDGAVYIADSLANADSLIRISGGTGEELGWRVAGTGDMNGDGVGEVAVTGQSEYEVFVFSGPITEDKSTDSASATITSPDHVSQFGTSIAGADIDGDGFFDLVASAPGASSDSVDYAGMIAIFNGPIDGAYDMNDADTRIYGAEEGDGLGDLIAVLPDADGDGRSDIAAGFTYGTETIIVTDISPGDFDRSIAPATYESASTVASLTSCDVNGDSLSDIVRGAPYEGGVLVSIAPFDGTYPAGEANWLLLGETSWLSGNVVSCGDIDEDGLDDVLSLAPNYPSGKTIVGSAYLFLGSDFPPVE